MNFKKFTDIVFDKYPGRFVIPGFACTISYDDENITTTELIAFNSIRYTHSRQYWMDIVICLDIERYNKYKDIYFNKFAYADNRNDGIGSPEAVFSKEKIETAFYETDDERIRAFGAYVPISACDIEKFFPLVHETRPL